MSNEQTPNTIYGVAIGMVKHGQVYLSRRKESVLYPKKWQFVNGRMRDDAHAVDEAARIFKDQTDISVKDKTRFIFVKGISSHEYREFYFTYLINLTEDEIPKNTCDRFHDDWRPFNLDKAEMLDVVDGLRPVLKQMKKTKSKYESYRKAMNEFFLETDSKKHEENAETIAKLGPKMTRLL